jgi:hypothetical protein
MLGAVGFARETASGERGKQDGKRKEKKMKKKNGREGLKVKECDKRELEDDM